MFRIGFVLTLLVFAGIVSATAVAMRPMPANSLPPASPPPAQATERTQTGIDVLEQQNFAPLRGKRVGLITNQTGTDSKGRRTVDVLAHADGVKLVALLSPSMASPVSSTLRTSPTPPTPPPA